MSDNARAVFGHRSSATPTSRTTTDSLGPHHALASSAAPTSTGAGTPHCSVPTTRRHLRGPRQRDDHQAPAKSRACCAAPTRARTPGDDPILPQSSASPRWNSCRCISSYRTRSHELGRRNYWGYNTIGFFAPHNEYTCHRHARPAGQEFKGMVLELHQAGIEVILDVVYNHTAEGNEQGPTLSFRGIENTTYYRLDRERSPSLLRHHRHRQLLQRPPPALAAADHGLACVTGSARCTWTASGSIWPPASPASSSSVDRLSTFFDLVQQDPVVSQVKLIAEPWDLGEGGLPGRQLPAAVDRVEREVPGHGPRLLARSARLPAGVRQPVHRVLRPVPRRRPQPARLRSTSSPRTTDSRCGPRLVQREAQRRQRRGQPRWRVVQPVLELRRRRARPTIRPCWPYGPASSATSWPRCC